MKNIHLLSTEKPSRLFNCFGKLEIGDYTTIRENLQVTNQHIYITSDEEITGFENNIWVIKADRIFLWQNTMALVSNNKPKKIILTTDQDLIKDGVQPIDDEFLEWFVNNPSCENVKVELIEEIPSGFTFGMFGNDEPPTELVYKIIIPTEEPKQETHICKYCNAETTQSDDECYAKPKTLDEAAENYAEGKSSSSVFQEAHKKDFIEGAKWQQERMYSEEIELINWLQSLTAKKFYSSDAEDLIKQFKKK